ncbi:hypothetical protein Anacy_2988 [Anabaena cylindrica PCC 7122]|uniref:Uncharacterized protein n=1 Tax=Anabaena cylindrica (strain ATCC 27899 / PCC 7122) TaxID=272123 RepID=K9ZGP7_ANACC|nr:hypothetical protein Anacy_2988 [Anabaena cylindrica PCC 7122]BAY04602.1 hypothetical protein NIES19_38670 [Anabaena cylindrica PCC 7122]
MSIEVGNSSYHVMEEGLKAAVSDQGKISRVQFVYPLIQKQVNRVALVSWKWNLKAKEQQPHNRLMVLIGWGEISK